jgi:hypothetical protein
VSGNISCSWIPISRVSDQSSSRGMDVASEG